MEKNNDLKLNASIENALKSNTKVKELASSNPELGSYLTQLGNNLNDAVGSICEAYGVLDLLEKNMSIGSNYKEDMTSEADSIRLPVCGVRVLPSSTPLTTVRSS